MVRLVRWIRHRHGSKELVVGRQFPNIQFPARLPRARNPAWQLEDLYLNDNRLEGGIPERLIVNCERLQRLVVAGNQLTGRVPRSLASVQDLRELNIERNNMHGEVCERVCVL